MSSRRAKDFKKGVDGDDSRRRRGEKGVQVRKQKREEGLAKKRHITMTGEGSPVPLGSAGMNNSVGAIALGGGEVGGAGVVDAGKKAPAFTITDIPMLATGILTSTDPEEQLRCTRGIRKLLSIEGNPPVQQVLDAHILPSLVAFLSRSDQNDLQFEAAWALTNIASTDMTRVVVQAGAVPLLSELLGNQSADLREQCAWCLGNIAGDCAELRDLVLSTNAMQGLLANVAQPANLTLLRNCVWALSNFCRGKPQPDIELMKPVLPALVHLLSSEDLEVLTDAGWALSYLSDGDNDRIQVVVDHNLCPSLAKMLAHETSSVVTPALRTLGNIVTGDDDQTQAVVSSGVLTTLAKLLQHNKTSIRKETCWMLSNIAAGSSAQISEMVQVPYILEGVVAQLSCSEFHVQKEATWVVSNIATGGSPEHVRALVNAGVIKPLCDLLTVQDSKIVMVALEAVEAMLSKDTSEGGDYGVLIEEADGVDYIEKLQEHANEKVYEKAVQIIEKYFGEEGEGEDDVAAPTISQDASTYNFGMQTAANPGDAAAQQQMQQQQQGQAPQGGFNFGGGFS